MLRKRQLLIAWRPWAITSPNSDPSLNIFCMIHEVHAVVKVYHGLSVRPTLPPLAVEATDVMT